MERMTLSDLLERARDVLGAQALPGDLANLLTGFLLDLPADEARGLLLPAVFAWVHEAERSRARHDRRVAAGPAVVRNPNTVRPAAGLNQAQEVMARFLSQTCEVPGHGRVPWGKMTAEYHRLHAQLLEGRLAAVTAVTSAAVTRHELAAGLLDESGCTDLEEYMDEYGDLPGELTEAQVMPALPA